MFEASEALQKMDGMEKMKSMSFHPYSWNSEVETTWISLIGWHHKTSNVQPLCPDTQLGQIQKIRQKSDLKKVKLKVPTLARNSLTYLWYEALPIIIIPFM